MCNCVECLEDQHYSLFLSYGIMASFVVKNEHCKWLYNKEIGLGAYNMFSNLG